MWKENITSAKAMEYSFGLRQKIIDTSAVLPIPDLGRYLVVGLAVVLLWP